MDGRMSVCRASQWQVIHSSQWIMNSVSENKQFISFRAITSVPSASLLLNFLCFLAFFSATYPNHYRYILVPNRVHPSLITTLNEYRSHRSSLSLFCWFETDWLITIWSDYFVYNKLKQFKKWHRNETEKLQKYLVVLKWVDVCEFYHKFLPITILSRIWTRFGN